MKLQASELPLGKPQTRRKAPKIAPLIILTVLLTTIPLYYPYTRYHKKLSESSRSYESLQNSEKIRNDINPPKGQDYQPCMSEKVDTERCNLQGGGDMVAQRGKIVDRTFEYNQDEARTKLLLVNEAYNPPARRKPEKGKGKRNRRAQTDHISLNHSEANKLKRTNRDNRSIIRSKVLDEEKCDLFSGEWVPTPDGPYYTNMTCDAIQEHQNCMKFGRPDLGFLKWRWRPDDCELPIFNPQQFLELVRGKSLAFVGDSVARNHMQSLICLLSRVTNHLDLSDFADQNRRYQFESYDFNISMFWSPYLIRTERTDPNDVTRPFKLYLDEFDPEWMTKIETFDYVVISAGHWFFRPTYFYLNRRLVGCLYCPESNVSHLASFFSYRRAFRTALQGINTVKNFKGITYLRTFAPSHFEGGPWDKGGDCPRRKPFNRNETKLEDYSLEMYLIQLEELRIAQKAGGRSGVKFRLFDATKPMLLRPDGHPSKYGHWPKENVTMANDCVHWCLPGPIDSWNDFLHELLKREIGDSISYT